MLPLYQQLSVLTLQSVKRTLYLLLAQFSTDRAAPLPSTLPCEIGSLKVTDTYQTMSVSGGKLHMSAPSPVATDEAVMSEAIARSPGMAIQVQSTYISGQQAVPIGLSGTQVWGLNAAENIGLAVVGYGYLYGSKTLPNLFSGSGFVYFGNGATRVYMLLLRDSGMFYFIDGALAYVSRESSVSPLYALSATVYSTTDVDNFKIKQLPAPYADESWYTSKLANPSIGATCQHIARCVIEVVWVVSGTQILDVHFRKVDASNYWRVYAGGLFCALVECVNGVETVRAQYLWPSAPSVGSTIRLCIAVGSVDSLADGNPANRYIGYVYSLQFNPQPLWMWEYVSTGSSQNGTTLEVANVAGGIPEIVCWPAVPGIEV